MKGGGWEPVAEEPAWGDRIAVHRATAPSGGLPAMVLIHGLEDDWRSWANFAHEMAGRYRCYAADLPWRTGGDHSWRTAAGPAQWVARALSLVPEPVAVVTAHSLGANLSLRWLSNGSRPDVDALVLVSPFYLRPSGSVSWRTFERAVRDFRTMMSEGMRVRLGERAALLEADVVDLMTHKVLDRIGPRGFFVGFEEYMSSGELALGSVRIPTLLIANGTDPWLDGPAVHALASAMPAIRHEIHPYLTHFCHVEQSAETASLANAFLDRHVSLQKGPP